MARDESPRSLARAARLRDAGRAAGRAAARGSKKEGRIRAWSSSSAERCYVSLKQTNHMILTFGGQLARFCNLNSHSLGCIQLSKLRPIELRFLQFCLSQMVLSFGIPECRLI